MQQLDDPLLAKDVIPQTSRLSQQQQDGLFEFLSRGWNQERMLGEQLYTLLFRQLQVVPKQLDLLVQHLG